MAGNTNQNTLIQETEVQAIKAEFDGTCRIIKDLGEFTYVVTLQPSGKDIIYKFQMTGIHRWYYIYIYSVQNYLTDMSTSLPMACVAIKSKFVLYSLIKWHTLHVY